VVLPGSQSESSTATAKNPTDHQNATSNAPARFPGWALAAVARMTARTAVPNEPPWLHSEAVLAMPFDLMRHDLIMNLKPVSPERIAAIVDDLFMPLVRRR
jgi:hypothetical protein